MISNARTLPVLLIVFTFLSGTPLFGQSSGGKAGGGTASGAGSEGEAEPQPTSNASEEEAICAAICDYEDAVRADESAESKTAAADKLVEALRDIFESKDEGLADSAVGSSSTKKGKCSCSNGQGGTMKVSYKILTSTQSATVSGKEDFVIALAGEKMSSGDGYDAKATNTGDGVAIASGGENTATGTGGDAIAKSGSGDAHAMGGQGGGTSSGGSGNATSTTGTSMAAGGAGGNSGGSTTLAGGQGGSASAGFMGGLPYSAPGTLPVPAGQHGAGAWALAGPGIGGSGGGPFIGN